MAFRALETAVFLVARVSWRSVSCGSGAKMLRTYKVSVQHKLLNFARKGRVLVGDGLVNAATILTAATLARTI